MEKKSPQFRRFTTEQGRKRPLDTPKRMIERREREGERERKKGRRRDIEREGEIRERDIIYIYIYRGRERGERDREVNWIERVKGAQSKPNP